jgi:predicted sugar kinase
LSGESGRLVNETLWPAVENDDFETFGQALQSLHQMNLAALARAGTPANLSAGDQAILKLMQDNGAVAWGQSLTGVCLYGLVKGAKASQVLRKKLLDHVGFFGGTVMATITDNRGAVEATKDKNLVNNKMTPLRLNLPK